MRRPTSCCTTSPRWTRRCSTSGKGAGVRAGIYDKLRVRVATLEGEVLAWTYVLVAYEGGLPSCHYLGLITEAAEKAGAPADYVATLRSHPCTGSSPTD